MGGGELKSLEKKRERERKGEAIEEERERRKKKPLWPLLLPLVAIDRTGLANIEAHATKIVIVIDLITGFQEDI